MLPIFWLARRGESGVAGGASILEFFVAPLFTHLRNIFH